MRIVSLMNNRLPPVFNNSGFSTVRSVMPVLSPRQNDAADGRYNPSVVFKISPEARALYANLDLMTRFKPAQSTAAPQNNLANVQETPDINEITECQTCAERKYVDQSADGSVSFQSPESVSPEAAQSAVRAHEGEHIANERARAEQNGRRILSQSVVIYMDICPECGKAYVAGGEARTTTAPKNHQTALRAYQAMQNMAHDMLNA